MLRTTELDPSIDAAGHVEPADSVSLPPVAGAINTSASRFLSTESTARSPCGP